MSIVMEKSSFDVANVILSQSDMFTFKEIVEQINKKGLQIEEERVILTLRSLKNSGLINDYGTKYSLSSLMLR